MTTICQAENLMRYCTGSRVKSRERATIFLQQWYPQKGRTPCLNTSAGAGNNSH